RLSEMPLRRLFRQVAAIRAGADRVCQMPAERGVHAADFLDRMSDPPRHGGARFFGDAAARPDSPGDARGGADLAEQALAFVLESHGASFAGTGDGPFQFGIDVAKALAVGAQCPAVDSLDAGGLQR